MDLQDDGRRSDRAEQIIRDLKSSAPASLRLEVLPFDTQYSRGGLRSENPGGAGHRPRRGDRVSRDPAPQYSDADGAIVITDGGDETVPDRPDCPPSRSRSSESVPRPENWNDIGIGNVTAPATVEEKSSFDRSGRSLRPAGRRPGPLNALQVTLDEQHDGKWTESQSQTVDLSSFHAAVAFHISVDGTGSLRYRVRLPQLPGELTYANNTRAFAVQVQPRAVRVLYYTQELGVDYKYLRNELATDPGVLFTAMYRVLQDQFTVQGDRTGYQDLASGLPTRDEVLRRYDCMILGSFPAASLNDAQMQALVRFVNNGGAAIFLGGEQSFGRGGYAGEQAGPAHPVDTPRPRARSRHRQLSRSRSRFRPRRSTSPAAGARRSAAAGGATLESLNQPGGLRPGGVALLEAADSGENVPGRRLAAVRQGPDPRHRDEHDVEMGRVRRCALRDFDGKFWRQTVRGLTQKTGGRRAAGHSLERSRSTGPASRPWPRSSCAARTNAVRLVATLHGPGGDRAIDLVPVTGQPGHDTAKIELGARGDYTFRITAYSGGSVAESYERVLPVEPLVEEGASPELKEAYLRDIADQAHGIYTDERHLEPVAAFLRQQVMAEQEPAVARAAGRLSESLPAARARHPGDRMDRAAALQSRMNARAFTSFAPGRAGAVLNPRRRPGTVTWSDGKKVTGDLTLTPGKQLKIFTAGAPVELPLEETKQLRFSPESEKMQEGFYFPNAGQATQAKTGEVYPIRYIHTQIMHCPTAACWRDIFSPRCSTCRTTTARRKVILEAKQTGADGEKLADLTYPVAIDFSDTAAGACRLDLSRETIPDAQPPVVVAKPNLAAVSLQPGHHAANLDAAVARSAKAAGLRAGQRRLHVGWPELDADPAIVAAVQTGLHTLQDFYDTRTLLGTQADGDDVYSLVMMERQRQDRFVREGQDPLEPRRAPLEVRCRREQGFAGRSRLARHGPRHRRDCAAARR